jgi:predicted dehydrogenase
VVRSCCRHRGYRLDASGCDPFANRRRWRAHLLLSWSSIRGHAPDLVLAGEHGPLQLWPAARRTSISTKTQPPTFLRLLGAILTERLVRTLARPWFRRIRTHIRDDDQLGYIAELREFLAAATEGRAPVTPPENGRRDLEIVLAAYTAPREERWVDIPAP